jgi:high affinity Mn2+ porin
MTAALALSSGTGNYRIPVLSRSWRPITAYYSLPVAPDWRATIDYQFVANPAYNQGRGPVSAIAARLHTQF